MLFDSSSTQNGLTEYCLSETLLVEQVTEIHKEYKKYNHKLQNSCCKYKSIFLQIIANLVTSSPQAHRAVKKKKKNHIFILLLSTLSILLFISKVRIVSKSCDFIDLKLVSSPAGPIVTHLATCSP